MENNIMDNIKEVAETNIDAVTNACSKGNTGKNLLTGAGSAAVVVTLYELGKLLVKKVKAKKERKKYITKFVDAPAPDDENEDVEK